MLTNLFARQSRSLENPNTSLSDPANWLREALGGVPSSTNIIVNERTALQITAFWSAVNTISDTVGTLPWRLIQRNPDRTKTLITDSDALMLLETNPNPWMTPVVMKSTVQAHVLTWGDGYIWIRRRRNGEAGELWPLDPSITRARIEDNQLFYETRMSDQSMATIAARDIIHIPALSRDGVSGMSVIREQRESLGHSLAVNRFGSKFFANGAKPGGLVSFDGKVTNPEKIRKSIEEQYSGENVHGLLVMDNGAKYQSFAIPPEDAQFLQSREFTVDDIGRMFRLPAHFLNKMGQATFNNLEQMGSHFVLYTMTPWFTRWEQETGRKLLTETEMRRGYHFKIVSQELQRGDAKTRAEVYGLSINAGWMTRNEAREREDLNPIDGLDEPVLPANINELDDEPDEPAPVAPPPAEPEDDSDDRSTHIVRAMVQRMVDKESRAIVAFDKSADDFKAFIRKVDDFYQTHAAHLIENLALDDQAATRYCNATRDLLVEGHDVDNVVATIQTTGAELLVDLVGVKA